MAERVNLADTLEELLNITLQSFVNGTLEFDLGLPKDFCSQLLQPEPEPEPNDDLFPPSLSDTTGISIHPFLFYFCFRCFPTISSQNFMCLFSRSFEFSNFFLSTKQRTCPMCVYSCICMCMTNNCVYVYMFTHTHVC